MNFFLNKKRIGLKGSRVTNEGRRREKGMVNGKRTNKGNSELFAAFYTEANLKGK
jgi:hypothetical protein